MSATSSTSLPVSFDVSPFDRIHPTVSQDRLHYDDDGHGSTKMTHAYNYVGSEEAWRRRNAVKHVRLIIRQQPDCARVSTSMERGNLPVLYIYDADCRVWKTGVQLTHRRSFN